MPGFDGTGPRGLGPMTGGRRGFCTGYFPTPYPYGMYPWNRGFQTVLPTMVPPATTSGISPYMRTPFVPTYSKEQEKQMLEQQIQMLEQQLEAIRKRLGELSK